MLACDAENRLQMLVDYILDYILASVSRQQFGHDLGFVLTDELPQRVGNQVARLNYQSIAFCPDGQAVVTQLMNQTCAHG
jgi:hypothetical protein